MKKTLLAALVLASPVLNAADSPKTSVLEPLESPIPPHSVILGSVNVVPTKDPTHAKVLEFTTSYSHPTENPRFSIPFKASSIDPNKHAGLRIWVRCDNETNFGIRIHSSFKRKDNKLPVFRSDGFKATPQWQPFDMYFYKMIRSRVTDPVTGQIISGLDAPDNDDIAGLSAISFETGIGLRGSDGKGHLMVHKLELIHK